MVPIEFFDVAASSRQDADAVVEGRVRVTYAELSEMSGRIASELTGIGVTGEPMPVALYGRNSYRLLAAMLGVMRAGGVIVPVHERSTAEKALPHLRTTHRDISSMTGRAPRKSAGCRRSCLRCANASAWMGDQMAILAWTTSSVAATNASDLGSSLRGIRSVPCITGRLAGRPANPR
jgi:long-subunit acyl-CoA synthetase (AMP-forming)